MRMQAWEEFITKQEKRFGKQTIDKWLRSLKLIHYDSGNLYLEAQEAFQVSWFEEHIRPLLKTELLNNNYRQIKVHLSVQEALASKTPTKKEKKIFVPQFISDKLDPAATFENFIPSQANRVSINLLWELTGYDSTSHCFKEPTLKLGTYNPLFIWGGAGTGKTHLLMALAHAFKKRGLNVFYSRTETFTEHVVSAIRGGEMQLFRKSYRQPDILLFDDVHLLARKGATQEEFFHTFNSLHTTNRQLILTAQDPPSQLIDIEPRLISRFEWGISLHLDKLTREELHQVLTQRCAHLNFPLSHDVCSFLVDTFPKAHSLHRALEALILRVHLHSDALYHRQPHLIDAETVAQLLKDLIEKEAFRELTPQKIIAATSAFYGIRIEDLLGKAQNQECVGPRQLAMYLCRKELNLSYKAIGRLFFRDHSTVMTSVKHIEKQLSAPAGELLSTLFKIRRALESVAQ
jgi:chromosomal replication initiator protein